jgi:hypothetical protein
MVWRERRHFARSPTRASELTCVWLDLQRQRYFAQSPIFAWGNKTKYLGRVDSATGMAYRRRLWRDLYRSEEICLEVL